MKLYIDGPEDRGEGHYVLIAETGEYLAGHICSNISFARFDLHDRRPGWPQELAGRFGEYQVLHVGEDEMTHDELVKRNHALAAAQDR